MADFNAYPALDVRVPQMQPGPDLGNILEQANKIQAGRNENSLFPLKQQALQTDNAMNQLILGEAQQAQKYNNINRQLKGIDAQFRSGDIKGAEQAWEAMKSSFPEGKQWGEISENKLATAQKAYGQQELTATNRVRAGTAAAQQQQSGNAFGGGGAGGGAGYSPSQLDAVGKMTPQQTQQGPVANYHKAADEVAKIRNSKDPKGTWNNELLTNPEFAKVVGGEEFSWDNLDALKDALDARRDATAGFSLNAAQGIPNPKGKMEIAGNNIFDPYSGVWGASAPESAYQKAEIANVHEKNAIDREKNQIDREHWQAEYGSPDATDTTKSAPNPEAGNITGQTGLSNLGFMMLTQPSKVPIGSRRMASREVDAFLAKHGDVDTATLQEEYDAQTKLVGQNETRFNQTRIMERELLGTLANLKESTEAAGFGDLRLFNVAALTGGQEINNKKVAKVAQQMNQLRSELIGYNVATRASKGGQNRVTDIDKEEAENTIKNGFAAGSIEGLRDAVQDSTVKMGAVLQMAVHDGRRSVWDLFGVGDNYNKTHPKAEELEKQAAAWTGGREGKPISDPGAEAVLRRTGALTTPAAAASGSAPTSAPSPLPAGVSEDDIRHTMQVRNMTRDQVIERLNKSSDK